MAEPSDYVDLLDRKICITCNEGGGVLVCSQRGCPVTVHAKCICSEPKFDDLGNFYCPYCWYKRAVEKCQELRQKALIAKKALSSECDKFPQKDVAAKRKEPLAGDGNDDAAAAAAANAGDFRVCKEEETPVHVNPVEDSTNGLKFDKHIISVTRETRFVEGKENTATADPRYDKEDVRERIVQDGEEAEPLSASSLGKCTDGRSPDVAFAKGTQESIATSAENKGRMKDRGKVLPREPKMVTATGSYVSESIDSDSEALSVEKSHVKLKMQQKAYPHRVASIRKSPSRDRITRGKNDYHVNEEVTSSKTLRQPQRWSPKQVKQQTLLNAKRKRLRWTAEEEQTLKEGVLRFSVENQNIPWRKILEFGCHVFDNTRTPVDLKDKWKNITTKEGCK